jgi:hypothetical protein
MRDSQWQATKAAEQRAFGSIKKQVQYWRPYCHDHFAATALLPPPPPDCIDAILLCNTSVTCISWFLRSCAACATAVQQLLASAEYRTGTAEYWYSTAQLNPASMQHTRTGQTIAS